MHVSLFSILFACSNFLQKVPAVPVQDIFHDYIDDNEGNNGNQDATDVQLEMFMHMTSKNRTGQFCIKSSPYVLLTWVG